MNLKKIFLILILTFLMSGATVGYKLVGPSSHVDPVVWTTSASLDSTIPVQRSDRVDDEAPSDIQVVLLALRPEGFEPTEIHLSPGEYLFVVTNRTGLDETDVRLVRENGERLAEARVSARREGWKHRLRLNVDTYILSEMNHTNWTCRIIVDR